MANILGLQPTSHWTVKNYFYVYSYAQDGAHVIGGFPLTYSNYNHAVTLVKERFG